MRRCSLAVRGLNADFGPDLRSRPTPAPVVPASPCVMTARPSDDSLTHAGDVLNEKEFPRFRLQLLSAVALLIGVVLVWKHFHGGVPRHHVLHRGDLPAISCWWDLLVLPVLSWICLGRARVRLLNPADGGAERPRYAPGFLVAFGGAILVGAAISLLFTSKHEDAISYLLYALVAISFFVPIYRAESVLGFVLGMVLTFGSVLPLLFSCLLVVVGVVPYRVVRPALLSVGRWILKAGSAA